MMKKNKEIILVIAIILVLALQIWIGENMDKVSKGNIRKPAMSGTFYLANAVSLSSQLEGFFNNINIEYDGEKTRAFIAPHAGYIYSGKTAMFAYKELYMDLILREEDIFKVIILAPAHTEYTEGIVIPNYNYFRTPLGDVKVNSTKIKAETNNSPHEQEHAIEVQLPFLQYIFKKANKEFTIVPIIVGDINAEEAKAIAKDINKEIEENTIIIVSSDLSHYKSQEKAKETDNKTIHNILDINSNSNLDACGSNPIKILKEISRLRNWNSPKLLNYSTSGDVTLDKKAVVGYASISFTEKKEHLLLRLAHRTIQNVFDARTENFSCLEQSVPKSYLERKGSFVTLTINKRLRGCIGNITSTKTVFQGIIDNAKFAAFEDPRFDSLTEKEFEKVDIEISILSKPVDCSLSDIKKGDGVIIRQGVASSVYLPQVWEQLPDKETFLSSLCEKAGLDWNCYKEKETKFKRFEVEIIE
jgi:AmmeMemoRadiSam system protein B/AmmeMemoRadiSam system protein A